MSKNKKDILKINNKSKNDKNYYRFQLNKLLLLIISISIYSLVNAYQNIDQSDVSERLAESVYFKGKKINKISYEDIEKIQYSNSKKNSKEEIRNNSENMKNINKENIKIKTCDKEFSKRNKIFLGYWSAFRENDKKVEEKSLYKAYPFFGRNINNENVNVNDSKNNNNNDNKDNNNNDNDEELDKYFSKASSFYFLKKTKNNFPFYLTKLNSLKLLGKDIVEEVLDENIKENEKNNDYNDDDNDSGNYNKDNKNFREQKIFEFNLFSFYNNKTNLKLYNYDLNKLINNHIISNVQAKKFWKELIDINKKKLNPNFIRKGFTHFFKIAYESLSGGSYKEKKVNDIYNNNYNNDNKYKYKIKYNYNREYNNNNNQGENINDNYKEGENKKEKNEDEDYMNYFFPKESTSYVLFSVIICSLNYYICFYYIKNASISSIFYLIFSLISLAICEILYSMKNYFYSSIFLLLFINKIKSFIFSLFILIGFKTIDNDIFDFFNKCEDFSTFFYN